MSYTSGVLDGKSVKLTRLEVLSQSCLIRKSQAKSELISRNSDNHQSGTTIMVSHTEEDIFYTDHQGLERLHSQRLLQVTSN